MLLLCLFLLVLSMPMPMLWCGCRFVHHSIKPAVFIRCILHCPHRPIWLDHGILTLDHITIATLRLTLNIPRVVITDPVLERVLGRRLNESQVKTTSVKYEIEKAKVTHVVVHNVVLFVLLVGRFVVLESVGVFFMVHHLGVG